MAEISILGLSSCESIPDDEDWKSMDKTDVVELLLSCRKTLSEEKNKNVLIQKVIQQLESEVSFIFLLEITKISNINNYLAEVIEEKTTLEEQVEAQQLQITKLNQKISTVDESQSSDEISLLYPVSQE